MNRTSRLRISFLQSTTAHSCCAVSRAIHKIVNADQTVIILWDAKSKIQHFIRKASFKGDGAAEDFGFIVPSPSQPELDESGDEVFSVLKYITAPIVRTHSPGFGCSAPAASEMAKDASVIVLEEKRVGGFDAVVLKADTAEVLVTWLSENDYTFSDAVADWARLYVENDWVFTALKIAKPKAETSEPVTEADTLRISFKTDTPLFPYREPDSGDAAKSVDAEDRLLRIYFIADKAFAGSFKNGETWSGKKVWYGDITQHRQGLLNNLDLPKETGPSKTWWLTEFEDQWAYQKAPGDLYFSPDSDTKSLQRTAMSPSAPHDPLAYVALFIFVGVTFRRGFYFVKNTHNS